MNVRKFSANTSREAIRLLRDALGSDAVILSNRNVDGRVEILAMADDTIGSIEASTDTLGPIPAAPKFPPRLDMELAADSRAEQGKSLFEKNMAVSSGELADVMAEIRSMRGMLEAQLAEISWTNTQKRQPQKTEILREMLATGFSASLSRYLIDKLPEAELVTNGIDWIKSILTNNLSTITNENEILEKGGVYALVGPTGVGKTTTTAKLAARCVMRHGPAKLALITTDGYRIGGYEQLRFDTDSKNPDKFPPKYFYAMGLNFSTNLTIRL